MNKVDPHSEALSQPLSLHHNQPAKRRQRMPVRRCLAGYVLSHDIALKLASTLSGLPTYPTPNGHETRSFPISIEEKIRNDGLNYRVEIFFNGPERSVDIVLATLRYYRFRGPLPEVVEGEQEKALREWLEAKGNLSKSLVYCFLTLSTGITREEYQWEVRLR